MTSFVFEIVVAWTFARTSLSSLFSSIVASTFALPFHACTTQCAPTWSSPTECDSIAALVCAWLACVVCANSPANARSRTRGGIERTSLACRLVHFLHKKNRNYYERLDMNIHRQVHLHHFLVVFGAFAAPLPIQQVAIG